MLEVLSRTGQSRPDSRDKLGAGGQAEYEPAAPDAFMHDVVKPLYDCVFRETFAGLRQATAYYVRHQPELCEQLVLYDNDSRGGAPPDAQKPPLMVVRDGAGVDEAIRRLDGFLKLG